MASVQDLVAATPTTRQRSLDLLRAGSLAVVVLGHWLMAVVGWAGGRPVVDNALVHVPVAQHATWLLQVMPLFFVVGGAANLLSVDGARRRGWSYRAWLGGRVDRLLRPTAVLLGAWFAVALVGERVGVEVSLLRTLTKGVTQPLWFLAVYLLVVASAPVMLSLHRRAGVAVPMVLAVTAGLLESVGPGTANYVVVWLFAHQLGFWWGDWPARRATVLAAAGFLGLVAMTTLGPWPTSMVGLPGQSSNMSPPTVCILALTLLQLGLALRARPALERWLSRPGPWTAVVTANGVAMTVFLWHLTALVVVAAVLVPLGASSPCRGPAAGGPCARCGCSPPPPSSPGWSPSPPGSSGRRADLAPPDGAQRAGTR